MRNKILHSLFSFYSLILLSQQPIEGKIIRHENFKSNYVTSRNIDVWLPQNYTTNKKYAVLYMHDGQMLYDASTTWNKQAWEVDDVSSKLMKEHKVKDYIVVGIWNGGTTRHEDYFPQKPYESLTSKEKDYITTQLQKAQRIKDKFEPRSDNYLKFIVTELKPFIDTTYSVETSKDHTYIMGSSMGGLISMYALMEYPHIFSGAACLSTHWPGIFDTKDNPVPNTFFKYIKNKLKTIESNKLYFDYGDQTLDAMYPPLQKQVDNILNDYISNIKNKKKSTLPCWKTEFFPNKDHSEKAWQERLHIPLIFLLNN